MANREVPARGDYESMSIAEKLQAMTAVPLKKDRGSSEPWDDEIFLSTYVPKAKIRARPSLSTSAKYAVKVLTWLAGGPRPRKLADHILGVLFSITVPTSEDYVLLDQLIDESAPELTPPESETPLLTVLIDDWSPPDQTSKWDYIKTPETALTWYTGVRTLLLELNANEDSSKQAREAINLVGFLCLTYLRLCVKDMDDIKAHVALYTRDRFQTLWQPHTIPDSLILPSKDFARCFAEDFARFSPNCTKAITACVYSFGAGDELLRAVRRPVLTAGCLLSLQRVGLGAIHWIIRAAEAIRVPEVLLISYMASAQNSETTEVLLDVLQKFMPRSSKEYSWSWARVLTDTAFPELGITANPGYSITLAAVASLGAQDSPFYSIVSFSKVSNGVKDDAIKRGQTLVRLIRKDMADKAQTAEAIALEKAMSEAGQVRLMVDDQLEEGEDMGNIFNS